MSELAGPWAEHPDHRGTGVGGVGANASLTVLALRAIPSNLVLAMVKAIIQRTRRQARFRYECSALPSCLQVCGRSFGVFRSADSALQRSITSIAIWRNTRNLLKALNFVPVPRPAELNS